jgi:parallel beta-helix repeat protein
VKPICIENNEIVGNKKSGLLIKEGDADVSITNNKIIDNGDNGIDLKNLNKVIISNNILNGNTLSGIDICTCHATVSENIITNNETGLCVFGESIASVLKNKIHKNKRNGFEMRPTTLLTAFEDNEITNNDGIGTKSLFVFILSFFR